MITISEIKNSSAIKTYIEKADESLKALGYTEHSYAHVNKVSQTAGNILRELGYSERECELAEIAGYLHDIGNVINRVDHAQSGAIMAFRILDKMSASAEDIATIITAIGNHDEHTAFPVSPVSAALILADKSDVRRTRVRNKDIAVFDIHDRVNYSVVKSELKVKPEDTEGKRVIELKIQIDTEVCSVINFFEIFLNRMLLCRKAAERLDLEFSLIVNKQKML
ncbi:MAG: HD domain-containing protein [Acutalibacteraceae bacterium]|nr:HD domain-containing protein [Acutalibacteraceae bacterium]